MTVRKFNRGQPTVASTPAAAQLGQQPETQDRAARQAPSRAPSAPSCHASQVAAGRAQDAPSRQAEGDRGPQPGNFTPWEALQTVQAELQAQGPVFDKPVEAVLADLGQKPATDGGTRPKSREGLPRFDVHRRGQPVRYQSWEYLLALGELKLEVLDGQLSLTADQLRALGGLLLESLGTDVVLELTGARSWREALEALDNGPAGEPSASPPRGRPGWTVFEKVAQDGLLQVPAQVLHVLGLSAGGWLAFFASVDGQIVVLSKDEYRVRFGPGLDSF